MNVALGYPLCVCVFVSAGVCVYACAIIQSFVYIVLPFLSFLYIYIYIYIYIYVCKCYINLFLSMYTLIQGLLTLLYICFDQIIFIIISF